MSRRVFLAAATLAMLGCRARPPAEMVVGPYEAESSVELWERALAAVRAARYEPEHVDPNRGQIVVPSHIYGSRERFMVQLYREGWLQVRVVSQRRGRWKPRIPPELAEEHLELTLALRAHFEGEGASSGGEAEEPES
jgi:hypothetical protein